MCDPADSKPQPRGVKVAVVGSGLAGLTAAYLLSTVHQRADVRHNGGPVEYEVHVFEKVCVLSSFPPISPTLKAILPSPFLGGIYVSFGRYDTSPSFSFPLSPTNCTVMRSIRLTHSEWTLTQFHSRCPAKRGNGVLMCRCALSREVSTPRDSPNRVG